jgi:circadian clock protein KaiB
VAESKRIRDSTAEFERTLEEGLSYELYLYVAGTTVHSARAVQVIRQVCSHVLNDRCKLYIIDIYKSPELAREAQIVAVPTLVRTAPPPVRKLIGDLSDRNRVLRFLEVPAVAREGSA